MATGAYVRIERDGKFINVEIDKLSDQELEKLAADLPDQGWMWAIFLAKWIRDNVS